MSLSLFVAVRCVSGMWASEVPLGVTGGSGGLPDGKCSLCSMSPSGETGGTALRQASRGWGGGCGFKSLSGRS